MEIKSSFEGKSLNVALVGRLDTNTAPELEGLLKEKIDGAESLHFDFSALDYLSSAGLRVLLGAQKKMNAAGRSMTVANCNATVTEIFEITGMNNILNLI